MFRPTTFHLAFTLGLLVALPWLEVATVQSPQPSCVPAVAIHHFTPPGWTPPHSCATLVTTQPLAPVALPFHDPPDLGPSYRASTYIVPSPALVAVPLALYLLASLLLGGWRLYGDDWRAAGRWLAQPSRGRLVFTVLGAAPLLGTFLPTLLGMRNDDSFSALNIALAPFYLLDRWLMEGLLGLARDAAPGYALSGATVSSGHYQDLRGAARLGTTVAASLLTVAAWYLLHPFLRAFGRGLRDRVGLRVSRPAARILLVGLLAAAASLLAAALLMKLRFAALPDQPPEAWARLVLLAGALAVVAFGATRAARGHPAGWAAWVALPVLALVAFTAAQSPRALPAALLWGLGVVLGAAAGAAIARPARPAPS